jgi:hypothetical protein
MTSALTISRISAALLMLAVASCFLSYSDHHEQKLPEVKSVELRSVDPSLFSKEEWYVPYYLKNFSRVANSVLDTGTNRGFINISVWRTPDVNMPYNARIMESILSLTWFYTTKRPWNPYYGDPALQKRIETALTFWCNIQNDNGKFSEYAPKKWSLAPTAFATKFIGRALYILEESGQKIDQKVLARANESLRKALFIGFTDADLWEHGRNFTNQYANFWGGAMMYLKHHPDKVIDQLLTNRLDQSMAEFQSPCGYFYEKNGPDWGYNLNTHHSDLHVAWHYAKGTRLQDYFVEKTVLWYDWFSYNAVKEPGSSRYYLNKAVETRQQRWFIDTDTLENPSSARWTPQAEFVPMARAFSLSKEEYEAAVDRQYKQMRDHYPEVKELKVGEFWTFSPYAFLHNDLIRWLPSQQQKTTAIRELPYLKSEQFTSVRSDRRNNTEHAFVRHPSYYAIFNSGKIITDLQRYGLGLIWNPSMGTVFQSQSNSDIAAWGTKISANPKVYEASDILPAFQVNAQPWKPAPGINPVEGPLSISYQLGTAGSKTIRFDQDAIAVHVDHKDAFTEVLPLLVDQNTTLDISDQRILLKNTKGTLVITLETPAKVTKRVEPIETRGGKPCQVIEIQANDHLKYSLKFK